MIRKYLNKSDSDKEKAMIKKYRSNNFLEFLKFFKNIHNFINMQTGIF
jgi:hypothetical protein